MGKISRSWRLMRASWRVLKQDKELLLFPVISSIALVLILLSFAAPVIGLGTSRLMEAAAESSSLPYVLGFAFYFVTYTVMIFFNAALIACAFKRMDGGDPTLGYGLRAAWERLPQVLGWAALTATVGFLLRLIEERVPAVGKIAVALLGMAWAVTSYLVVPVLVAKGSGPIDAYKDSVALLRKSWGEQLVGNVGFGFIFFLLSLIPIGIAVAAFMLAGPAVSMPVVAACVLGLIALAAIQATLQAIYNAAIYRYAAGDEAPAGFDGALLAESFRQK